MRMLIMFVVNHEMVGDPEVCMYNIVIMYNIAIKTMET